MSTHNGNWFAVSRMVFDHYIVGAAQPVRPDDETRGAYSKMEAWLDLIAMAAYEPTKIMNKGREQTLDPGQLMGGVGYLADRWNWSNETVRWFLKQLQMSLMITRFCAIQKASRNTNQVQVLTISNYSNYQLSNYDQPQAKPQPEPQAHPKRTPSAPQESNNKQTTTPTDANPVADAVVVNCSAIYGPGFTLDFGSIDMAAKLGGMAPERARMVAEMMARDWAANGVKPQVPMAMVRKAIATEINTGQIWEGRKAKATEAAESAGDKIRRFAEEAEANARQKKGLRP
jgi:hypothetical protein